jgi:hypothetical protein
MTRFCKQFIARTISAGFSLLGVQLSSAALARRVQMPIARQANSAFLNMVIPLAKNLRQYGRDDIAAEGN